MANDHSGTGTGAKLTKATVIVCGVASLVATLLSFVYVAPADSPGSCANQMVRVQVNMATDVGEQSQIPR